MRLLFVAVACLLIVPTMAGCLEDEATKGDVGNSKRNAKAGAGVKDAGQFVASLPDGSLVDPSLLLDVPALAGEQRFIGTRTFEPTLGINKEGHIFMVAFGGGAKIYKSSDKGVTWSDTTAKLPTGHNNPPNSNDPFVWVDRETGRVFASDLQALICSWLNYSDDGGKTWTTNPIGCGHPFGVHDHQSVATGKSRGTPSTWQNRMVYYCVNRVGDSSCAASPNGGLTFGPLVPIMLGADVERAGFCGGLTGHVKTDHAGRVLLGRSYCGGVRIGVSEDDGRTWKVATVPSPAGIRGHDVEIAADEADNLYAFWLSSAGLPQLSISRDHAAKWSPAITVGAPGITAAKFPSIAAAAPGKIAFSYLGTKIEKGFAAADWSSATWHGYLAVMVDALAESPITLTTMVDSEENPMAKGACAGRCDGMGDFFDTQIDPDGRPWTAFVDVCNDACVKGSANDANMGVTGTLTAGPALTKEGGALPALPPLVVAAAKA